MKYIGSNYIISRSITFPNWDRVYFTPRGELGQGQVLNMPEANPYPFLSWVPPPPGPLGTIFEIKLLVVLGWCYHWSFWSGHHQTGQAACGLIALRVGELQWVTMNYSFVIQTVIQFVTQAVLADASSGRGIIKIGCPLGRTSVRVGWAEGSLRAGKCMLNQCSDYDDG